MSRGGNLGSTAGILEKLSQSTKEALNATELSWIWGSVDQKQALQAHYTKAQESGLLPILAKDENSITQWGQMLAEEINTGYQSSEVQENLRRSPTFTAEQKIPRPKLLEKLISGTSPAAMFVTRIELGFYGHENLPDKGVKAVFTGASTHNDPDPTAPLAVAVRNAIAQDFQSTVELVTSDAEAMNMVFGNGLSKGVETIVSALVDTVKDKNPEEWATSIAPGTPELIPQEKPAVEPKPSQSEAAPAKAAALPTEDETRFSALHRTFAEKILSGPNEQLRQSFKTITSDDERARELTNALRHNYESAQESGRLDAMLRELGDKKAIDTLADSLVELVSKPRFAEKPEQWAAAITPPTPERVRAANIKALQETFLGKAFVGLDGSGRNSAEVLAIQENPSIRRSVYTAIERHYDESIKSDAFRELFLEGNGGPRIDKWAERLLTRVDGMHDIEQWPTMLAPAMKAKGKGPVAEPVAESKPAPVKEKIAAGASPAVKLPKPAASSATLLDAQYLNAKQTGILLWKKTKYVMPEAPKTVKEFRAQKTARNSFDTLGFELREATEGATFVVPVNFADKQLGVVVARKGKEANGSDTQFLYYNPQSKTAANTKEWDRTAKSVGKALRDALNLKTAPSLQKAFGTSTDEPSSLRHVTLIGQGLAKTLQQEHTGLRHASEGALQSYVSQLIRDPNKVTAPSAALAEEEAAVHSSARVKAKPVVQSKPAEPQAAVARLNSRGVTLIAERLTKAFRTDINSNTAHRALLHKDHAGRISAAITAHVTEANNSGLLAIFSNKSEAANNADIINGWAKELHKQTVSMGNFPDVTKALRSLEKTKFSDLLGKRVAAAYQEQHGKNLPALALESAVVNIQQLVEDLPKQNTGLQLQQAFSKGFDSGVAALAKTVPISALDAEVAKAMTTPQFAATKPAHDPLKDSFDLGSSMYDFRRAPSADARPAQAKAVVEPPVMVSRPASPWRKSEIDTPPASPPRPASPMQDVDLSDAVTILTTPPLPQQLAVSRRTQSPTPDVSIAATTKNQSLSSSAEPSVVPSGMSSAGSSPKDSPRDKKPDAVDQAAMKKALSIITGTNWTERATAATPSKNAKKTISPQPSAGDLNNLNMAAFSEDFKHKRAFSGLSDDGKADEEKQPSQQPWLLRVFFRNKDVLATHNPNTLRGGRQ